MLITIWAGEYGEYEDERDARFINDRVRGTVLEGSMCAVVPEMPSGVCTPAKLMRIAEVRVKYDVPLVKLNAGQRIDLVGIRKDDLPRVWQDLHMPAGWFAGRPLLDAPRTDSCRERTVDLRDN